MKKNGKSGQEFQALLAAAGAIRLGLALREQRHDADVDAADRVGRVREVAQDAVGGLRDQDGACDPLPVPHG